MRHVHTWILAAPLLVGSAVLAHSAFVPSPPLAIERAAAAGGAGGDSCARTSRRSADASAVVPPVVEDGDTCGAQGIP